MESIKKTRVAVIGGGPAGLRAAEVIAESGISVDLFEGKRSTGRKFLVAGKSGLNLTNAERFPEFLTKYENAQEYWNEIITSFNNDDLRSWARSLGIETYTASSGKVFPVEMKAAPLLRRLVEKLRKLGVNFYHQYDWTGMIQSQSTSQISLQFRDQPQTEPYDAVVFALGGGSWQQTGSDGRWVEHFRGLGIDIAPLTAANCGWETAWDPDFLAKAEGLPLKNIVLSAGEFSRHGELVITNYGLEGGPIYRAGSAIKALPKPLIHLDLKPSFTTSQLVKKMESAKRTILKEAAQRWKLSTAQSELMRSQLVQHQTLANKELDSDDIQSLAAYIKSIPIPLTQPRPLSEAISSAGGVKWSELTKDLMLTQYPSVYCIGEMLDWEAPTGGYLLQGCFSSATHVGREIGKSF